MKRFSRWSLTVLLAVLTLSVCVLPAFAGEETDAAGTSESEMSVEAAAAAAEAETSASKAWAAALVVGAVAVAGAIAMGWSITRAMDGIARQPEAGGQIRTGMMLGLVFIETVVIYALIVAILVIFVL